MGHHFDHDHFPISEDDLIRETTLDALEAVERIDPDKQQFIWADGQALSFEKSLQRVHDGQPGVAVEDIARHIIIWLEMDELPGEIDATTDQKISEWVSLLDNNLFSSD